MKYIGDYIRSETIQSKFTTIAGDGTPTTLAGTPAVSVYKSNSTTQSTSGITLSVDFDSVTGLNNVEIDLSSDATFYAPGNDYMVVITAGTVDGTSVVGYVVALFSIENRMPAELGITGSVSDATPAAGNFDGDSGLSATDDFYNGSGIVFMTGTLKGIARKISDYTGSSKNIVVSTAFPSAPADGDLFTILGRIE